MNTRNTFRLFFYINSSKIKKNGECPIMLRITIDSKNTTLSIKRSVSKDQWSVEAGLAKGKSPEINSLNKYIDAVRAKAYEKFTELHTQHENVTPNLLRDSILGNTDSNTKMLFEVWQEHNNRLKELIGRDNSYSLWQKYNSCQSYFREFLLKKLNKKDIAIKIIDRETVLKFEHFLKIDRCCSFNTTIKYLQQFKKIIRIGIQNGWLKQDPFLNIKLNLKEVERPYLTEAELRQILEKQISIKRLEVVRDIFVFSCFTGLSYSDIKRLNKSEIEVDADGSSWIRSNRQKTGVRANIPLLEIPISIMKKYSIYEPSNDKAPLLPVSSNQKVNAYLKEIADICGITKQLTFHCARHTFATTVTLTHGVPIESVSKMLGHKNIKQTQHYARIVDLKVGEDMLNLSLRLGNKLQLAGLGK